MKQQDELLVKATQQGTYSAFEKLYEQYFSRIYSFIMIKSGGNVPLTQDVCSETFLKAFERISDFSFDEGSSFSAWLYTIAYHSFIDAIKVKQVSSLDDDLDQHSMTPDYVDLFQKKEQSKEILNYLESLGSEKKDIFLFRIWEKMSYEEIATIIGKTPESCRQEFSRTLKKVLEKFSHFA